MTDSPKRKAVDARREIDELTAMSFRIISERLRHLADLAEKLAEALEPTDQAS